AGCDPQARAGERHDPETHLIPLVLEEALRTRDGGDPKATKLRVFGSDFPTKDGSCVRDYIHVSDLCDAHLLAADRLMAGKAKGAEAYNLANGVGFSVLEVISACREITGQPIEYQLAGRRAGDPATLIGDCTRAAQVLGWKPKQAELKTIIRTAWNWMTAT
ncbi:MAG TPA: NAD-dependent epimerase/dehydratase family protein, partial [Usitatibacter sp.]|nr:NAD-dependent epimerase/dehydratase family protein [Usitatibacter sp.]